MEEQLDTATKDSLNRWLGTINSDVKHLTAGLDAFRLSMATEMKDLARRLEAQTEEIKRQQQSHAEKDDARFAQVAADFSTLREWKVSISSKAAAIGALSGTFMALLSLVLGAAKLFTK